MLGVEDEGDIEAPAQVLRGRAAPQAVQEIAGERLLVPGAALPSGAEAGWRAARPPAGRRTASGRLPLRSGSMFPSRETALRRMPIMLSPGGDLGEHARKLGGKPPQLAQLPPIVAQLVARTEAPPQEQPRHLLEAAACRRGPRFTAGGSLVVRRCTTWGGM